MNIVVIGTGYVGLITGVGLAQIGHHVTCIDLDELKINKLKQGISPIYEPGIEELLIENHQQGRLNFSTHLEDVMQRADIVYLAVGTPQGEDGRAELKYIESAAENVVHSLTKPIILVVKSTVPVGTNRKLQNKVNAVSPYKVTIVSNPEFLREGKALHDVFFGDRIVVGSDDADALEIMEKVNTHFNMPILKTSLESAELTKYAANAFLATKISFINEIANICENVGADIRDVSKGIGMDKRIGDKFLNAGIGFGGSCFPKDTNALLQISQDADVSFQLLQQVIQVNENQRTLLVDKLLEKIPNLANRKIAVLGIAFKPDTDDVREAPALAVIERLIQEHADVWAYDPIVTNIDQMYPQINITDIISDALSGADAALIVTEWVEIKLTTPNEFKKQMKSALILDGRNCLNQTDMVENGIEYYGIGIGEQKQLVVK